MVSPTSGTRTDLYRRYVTRINTSTEARGFAKVWTTVKREDVFDRPSRENVVMYLALSGESKEAEWNPAPQGLLAYKGRFRPIESDWITNAREQLDDMQTVVDGWNGYSAPAPSTLAINNARQFVNELHGIVPTAMRVAPSAIGGVGITLSKGEKAVYVEFYNDGSIYKMLIDDGIDTDVQPVRPDAHDLERLASEASEYIDN
ncbi:MAG: hypothetical protein IH966_03875 [Gemmatimonadetes bacterium]|nr:hypothetical protein [Gemmatimonadota bacterium]